MRKLNLHFLNHSFHSLAWLRLAKEIPDSRLSWGAFSVTARAIRSVGAPITEHRSLVAQTTDTYFLAVLETRNPRSRSQWGGCLGWGSALRSQTAAFSLWASNAFPGSMRTSRTRQWESETEKQKQRKNALWCLYSEGHKSYWIKTLSLWPHLTLISLLKALLTNIVTKYWVILLDVSNLTSNVVWAQPHDSPHLHIEDRWVHSGLEVIRAPMSSYVLKVEP